MSKSQAEQVYGAVKRDILRCELQPGSVLAQPQLAARYQAGITPLREALHKLTSEGLIQPIPRFGYLVAPITLTDVQELFEVRAVLEIATARKAAARASAEQLQMLSQLAEFTYVYKNTLSYTEFLEKNRDFHLAVAAAAGNCRLLDMLAHVLDMMSRVFHLNLGVRDSAEQIRAEHRALVTALAAKDPDRCELLISEQIGQAKQRVLEALLVSVDASGSNPGMSVRVDTNGSESGSPPCQKGVSNGSNQLKPVRDFQEEK